jgi:hypothetical protein
MSTIAFDAARHFVRMILAQPHKHKWSLQGFGMLRLHLPGDMRLHVWDDRFRVPKVSDIHDHQQWGLESLVLSGSIINEKYAVKQDALLPGDEEHTHYEMTIEAGEGGGPRTLPVAVELLMLSRKFYPAGFSYRQQPEEIHRTVPDRGTVTLMQKYPVLGETGARVYWPIGTSWVSAEPRRATDEEVAEITGYALSQFDKGA